MTNYFVLRAYATVFPQAARIPSPDAAIEEIVRETQRLQDENRALVAELAELKARAEGNADEH